MFLEWLTSKLRAWLTNSILSSFLLFLKCLVCSHGKEIKSDDLPVQAQRLRQQQKQLSEIQLQLYYFKANSPKLITASEK